jgi:hypothetical protein
MDQEPRLPAVAAPDFEELVCQAPADAGVAHDLLQLLIEALVAAPPVDAGVGEWEQQRQEGLQEVLQGLLPRAV